MGESLEGLEVLGVGLDLDLGTGNGDSNGKEGSWGLLRTAVIAAVIASNCASVESRIS
jgi:hypothetical protein